MQNLRVRFAPSPTGPLHIGGVRSALFNYLLARKYEGTFVLRIEDTDLERSSREWEVNIIEAMDWLGIQWDEGPDKGGVYGPYRQTERLDIYRPYVAELLASGQAYLCYCDEGEVEAQRQMLLARGETPRYIGKCYSFTPREREQLEKEGRKPVVRFRVPEGELLVVDDLVRGQVSFESSGIGDFVIVKSDGIPTYNFAVVVDDTLMKITHVVRAEEHLSNTPRQLLLYRALGFTPPKFAHISLILGKDRTKMSKRHGATSVLQYQQMGYLPEALVNFLALLGWSPEGEQEIFSMAELIHRFSLDRVAKNPAIFDLDKLRWINGYYIRQTPIEVLTPIAAAHLVEAGYLQAPTGDKDEHLVARVVAAVRQKISSLGEITDYAPLFFADEVTLSEEAAFVLQGSQVPAVLGCFRKAVEAAETLDPESAKRLLKSIIKELKLGGSQVYQPIRAAVTGQVHGPDLTEILSVLEREKILGRLSRVHF